MCSLSGAHRTPLTPDSAVILRIVGKRGLEAEEEAAEGEEGAEGEGEEKPAEAAPAE